MTENMDRQDTPLDDWDNTEELDEEAVEERERIRVKLGLAAARTWTIAERYEILARQGQGGMGVVYHARDTRLDRDVALKLVRSRAFANEDRLRERLEREAKALAKLDGHDYVVTVYDVGRHHERIYFTMPFVRGFNLQRWQDEPDRSIDEIVDVYLQAARGLAAAHRVGIVHRDFKPGNVLLRADDRRAMVADFGIAEAMAGLDTPVETTEHSLEVSQHLTATGAILGTLPYVAPERIPCPDRPTLRAAPASDQFSFCVALWEALAGQVPFAATTTAEMLAALERGPVGADRLPWWLRPVLRRGLSREPEQRFPSMDALIQTIEHRRAAKRRLAPIGIGLVLGSVGIGAFIALSEPAPAPDEPPACSSFSNSATEVWNDTHRQAIAQHRERAPATIDHVMTQLDTLTQRWTTAAEQACVDGLAPAPDDPQRQCLEQWLLVVGEHVELLTNLDTRTASLAGQVVDRLLPPPAGFCAFSPPQAIDIELWSIAEAARTAALLGSDKQALSLANEAIARAEELAGGEERTADLAEAHAVRAEVLTRQGRYVDARPDYDEAEAHASASGHLERALAIRAFWAKARVQSKPAPFESEIALEDIRRARLLLSSITPLEQQTRLDAELEDAAGFVESRRDNYAAAVTHHRRAFELFSQIDQPVLCAKALNNLGTAQQMLEQWDEARTSYERARQVLDAAKVPLGHSTSIEVEFNLGILSLQLDRSEGFDHFATVARFRSGERQLEALTLALGLATNLDDEDRMGRLGDEILEWIGDRPIDSEMLVGAKSDVATALLTLGDERGDVLLDELDQLPEQVLPPALRLMLGRNWVRALEERMRCDDAAELLAKLDEHARRHALADDTFLAWRAKRPNAACKLPRFLSP